MKQHYVTFLSPGTIVAETTRKEIDSWNVKQAVGMSREILERHGARPYAFYFSTDKRGFRDLNSKRVKSSCTYFLGGKVMTLEEVEARKDRSDKTLLSNMRNNGFKRIITTTEGWSWTQPLKDDDVVIPQEQL